MEYPRLGLPLLLHWLPPGLDLRLSTHLRLLWLSLELLGLTLELTLSRRGRVPHLGLPLIVLGVHARRGPLLRLGDEYHSRDRDER